MKPNSRENSSPSGVSLKNYWLSIGVFWTLGGVILLAMEVKQIKQRVETLDRRIRTASIPKKVDPVAHEPGQNSPETKPFRVTEESLRSIIPAKQEADTLASIPTPGPPEETRSFPDSPGDQGKEALTVNTEVTIDDLQVRRVSQGVEARFVMKNNDLGREIEGRIGGVLKFTLNGIVTILADSSDIENEKVDPKLVHEAGQFYRFRYRLSKNIVFKTQKIPEDIDFNIEFYLGALGAAPSMIRLPPVKLPRVARGGQDRSRRGRDLAIP